MKPRYSILGFAFFILVMLAVTMTWMIAMSRRFSDAQQRLFDIASPSSLPKVKVAEEGRTWQLGIYKRDYEFTTDWFTYNIPIWKKLLSPVKGKPDIQYLEVGVYEGRSAIWMLEHILTHPTARLTVVDVFDGPYHERSLANLKQSGGSGKTTTLTGFSQEVLRTLPLNSFDIIYIDGSHAKEDVLEDAVLSWRLLKDDGLLIFDDYRWAGMFVAGTSDAPDDLPKPAIDSFVQCFEEHVDVVHNSYQLILRKTSRKSAVEREVQAFTGQTRDIRVSMEAAPIGLRLSPLPAGE